MTDSASLGRATLTVDVDASAFDSELRRVRQEAEQFAPSFGGLDQLLQRIAQRVGQLEETFRGAARQADAVAQAGRNVAAQEQGFQVVGRAAQRYLASLQDVTRQLQLLQRTPLNLDSTAGSRGLGSLGEAYNDARTEANEFARAVVNGQQALANTTAGVRQQAGALAALAANTDTASASYRTFVQAQEAAAQRLTGRQRFDELSALQNAYNLGNVGRRELERRGPGLRETIRQQNEVFQSLIPLSPDNPEISRTFRTAQNRYERARQELDRIGGLSTFNGVEELLAQADRISSVGAGRLGARSGNTPLTPAVLQTFVGQLERARENTVPFTPEFDRLTAAIQRLTQLLNRAQTPLSQAGSVVPPQRPLLPPAAPGSPAFSGRAVPINPFATPATYDRFAAQQERSARLAQKFAEQASYFDTPRTGGLRETPERLRQTIEQLTKLRDGLKQTDPLFDALNSDIAVLNSRLQRAERGQGALLARGANSVADERAFRQAQAEARAAREARLNELRQRPAQIEFQGRNGFRDFSSGAEERVRARARQEVIDRIDAQRRLSSRSGLTSFLQDIPTIQADLQAQQQARLERQRQALQQLSFGNAGRPPGGGGPPRGGRLGNAFGQGLIGGFFPLLFGQPPAAAVGGGVGGFLGGLIGGVGGFAGGLVGTALGTGLDSTIQSGIGLRDAFRDPINQFQALKEAAGLSSKAVERNAQSLIAQGRTAEAAALIQDDLSRSFGSLKAFQDYQNEQDKLARTFQRAKVSVGSFVAGPLTAFLAGIERRISVTRGVGGASGTPISPDRQAARRQIGEFIQANPSNLAAFEAFARSRGRQVDSQGRLIGRRGEVFGQTVAASDRLREDFGRQRGVFTGRPLTDPSGQAEQARRAAAEAAAANTRLQRTLGAATFNELRGNRLGALRNELAAFDQNRANRLAAADPNEKQAVLNQLVQERYRLEEQISAEKRNQAALDDQSASKIRDINRQTGTLRRAPNIADRDLRLLEARDSFGAAFDANLDARRARDRNPIDPNLRRAVDETAAALEQAAVRYNNQRIATERESVRLLLESTNRVASAQERGAIARLSPDLSGLGVSVLQARSQLNDAVRADREAQLALRQRPGDSDVQRAAIESAERLKTAGEEFRATLLQAFETAQREAEQLRRSIRDAEFGLAQSRVSRDPGSLNSQLPSGLIAVRERQGFNQLLPQFNEAKQFVRNQTGNQNFDLNFSGPIAEVNRRMIAFIQAARPEQNTTADLRNAYFDLAKATNTLSLVTQQLNSTLPQAVVDNTAALNRLFGKDWRVFVSVPSQPAFAPIPNTP